MHAINLVLEANVLTNDTILNDTITADFCAMHNYWIRYSRIFSHYRRFAVKWGKTGWSALSFALRWFIGIIKESFIFWYLSGRNYHWCLHFHVITMHFHQCFFFYIMLQTFNHVNFSTLLISSIISWYI